MTSQGKNLNDELQNNILRYIARTGLTTDAEIALQLNVHEAHVARNRRALAVDGFISSPRRVLNIRNNYANGWALSSEGRSRVKAIAK